MLYYLSQQTAIWAMLLFLPEKFGKPKVFSFKNQKKMEKEIKKSIKILMSAA